MVFDIFPKTAGTIGSMDLPAVFANFVGDYVLTATAFLVSTNSAQSTAVSVAVGTACMRGAQIWDDAGSSLNVATSATAYIYVIATLNASQRPTAIGYTTNATDAMTVSGFYSFRLAKVVSTTKVDTITDLRPQLPWSVQTMAMGLGMGTV